VCLWPHRIATDDPVARCFSWFVTLLRCAITVKRIEFFFKWKLLAIQPIWPACLSFFLVLTLTVDLESYFCISSQANFPAFFIVLASQAAARRFVLPWTQTFAVLLVRIECMKRGLLRSMIPSSVNLPATRLYAASLCKQWGPTWAGFCWGSKAHCIRWGSRYPTAWRGEFDAAFAKLLWPLVIRLDTAPFHDGGQRHNGQRQLSITCCESDVECYGTCWRQTRSYDRWPPTALPAHTISYHARYELPPPSFLSHTISFLYSTSV